MGQITRSDGVNCGIWAESVYATRACKEEVTGSNPLGSISSYPASAQWFVVYLYLSEGAFPGLRGGWKRNA